MTTSGSYDASTRHRDLASEIQRLRAQAHLSWQKEARTLAWFGLQDGMSVLDLGSGPGFITEQLLAMLPNSSVTALEIDPLLIRRAEDYLHGKAGGRLQLVETSIMATGLPDNRFDFAIARLIFQHLPDPVGAAREVWRVLKPGGRLAIIDVDDELWMILDPPVPHFQMVLEKFRQMQVAQGGNRRIGRRLWHILEAAGFQNIDLEAVVSHSDAVGIEAFLPQLDPDQLSSLVKAGLLSEKELGDVHASGEEFLASPEPMIMRLLLAACGEKP